MTIKATVVAIISHKKDDCSESYTGVVKASAILESLVQHGDKLVLLKDFEELEAHAYALEDQVKGLQELMGSGEHVEDHLAKQIDIVTFERDGLRTRLEAEKKQHAQVLELATRRWYVIAKKEAQLAEAHALLREVLVGLWPSTPIAIKINAALSASAEPSAPDETENCRGLSLDHRWAPGEITGHEFCTKCGEMRGAANMTEADKLAYIFTLLSSGTAGRFGGA